MPALEMNRRKIVARLEREGWLLKEGGEHSIYKREGSPGVRIVVPRHTQLSPGVAQLIAKLAGWK
jgi:mRNA interferase HicA